MGMAGRRESESTARAKYVSGGRGGGGGGGGGDRQQYIYEELSKEGDGQKEKMDGTRDKNTMIIACILRFLVEAHLDGK